MFNGGIVPPLITNTTRLRLVLGWGLCSACSILSIRNLIRTAWWFLTAPGRRIDISLEKLGSIMTVIDSLGELFCCMFHSFHCRRYVDICMEDIDSL